MDDDAPDHHAGHRHGHDHGAFGPLKAAFYAIRHPSGAGNDLVLFKGSPTEGDVVIDIGAGPGPAVIKAVKRYGAGRAVGIEPAATLRRIGSMRAWLARVADRAELVDGTAEALPLEDDSVDVAVAVNSLHHWEDIDKGLAEVARVLCHGGRFVSSDEDFSHGDHPRGRDPHADWPAVDYEHVTKALTVLGFEVEATRERADDVPVRVVTATKR